LSAVRNNPRAARTELRLDLLNVYVSMMPGTAILTTSSSGLRWRVRDEVTLNPPLAYVDCIGQDIVNGGDPKILAAAGPIAIAVSHLTHLLDAQGSRGAVGRTNRACR